ncbi:uncharacterized protein A4U43_C07F16940 [Asparagus officinalis]|uniref:F-box domain-containing protein n=1 Tax=Asparagus officinalis TaxID=4686 RepID=A0A5P1EFY4_ASPOF|nr:uncharacterized protein A4U43_C07F16940 [Asparagus officinalis]
MEGAGEGVEDKQAKGAQQIPVEIVQEILDRLPLKSLARFRCVSELWYDLIDPIMDRLLHEDILRRLQRVKEAQRSIKALYSEQKEEEGVDDFLACRAQVKAKMDEMLSLLDVRDCDYDMNRYINGLPGARDFVGKLREDLAGDNDESLREMDAWINVAFVFQRVFAPATGFAVNSSTPSLSSSEDSAGGGGGRAFSVIDEFSFWRKKPDLAEAVAAIMALAAVIRSSEATTMMELEIELKMASDALKTSDLNKALSPNWNMCNTIADVALQADK